MLKCHSNQNISLPPPVSLTELKQNKNDKSFWSHVTRRPFLKPLSHILSAQHTCFDPIANETTYHSPELLMHWSLRTYGITIQIPLKIDILHKSVPSKSWRRTKTVSKKERRKRDNVSKFTVYESSYISSIYIILDLSEFMILLWGSYYPVVRTELPGWRRRA